MTMKGLRKAKTDVSYTLSNSILNAVDVGSDCVTAVELISACHYFWGATNIGIMFLPFLFKLIMLTKDKVDGKELTRLHLSGLLLHIPFATPIVHLILANRLLCLYISAPKNASAVEEIMKVTGLGSLYESFCEGGPQLILQLHIIACTCKISLAQQISMPISLLSLTYAATRAFFVKRD